MNHHCFGSDFEKKQLKGWGYGYYELKKAFNPVTTLMACPDKKKTQQFITTHLGADNIVRYNSKLAMVVYVPKDMVIKYRVGSIPEKLDSAVIK